MILPTRGHGSGSSGSGKPEIQVIPLIDILFTLIVFLLVSISFTESGALEIDRPESTAAGKAPPESFTVTVRKDERVFVGREELTLPALRARLERECRRRPSLGVVVAADEAAPVRAAVRVMDECKKAGVKRVYVATREK